MNAVDEYFEFLKTAAPSKKERVAKDFELWNQWNTTGRGASTMKPLLKQFKPLIRRQANVYAGKNPNVPPEAVRAQFMNQAIRAFENYDPNRGAALGTHVNWQLFRAKRFIATYGGGVGRIPESRTYKVQQFTSARDELSDEFGRPATALEMADKLKWPVTDITSLEKEIKKEVPSSLLPMDTEIVMPSRADETLRLMQYELSGDENAVLEHIMGLNGKPKLKPGAIARKLNMAPSKVSRIKLNIASKMKEYLE